MRLKLFFLSFLFVCACSSDASKTSAKKLLEVGDLAPIVSGLNQNGKKIEISYNNKYTLVYFYPKAGTSGCTAQALSLRDAYEKLTKEGVQVYGVSTDSPEQQLAFKESQNLPFTLISDTNEKVAQAFDVSVTRGLSSRQAFLIKEGKVVWLDHSASTKKQADDILEFLKTSS